MDKKDDKIKNDKVKNDKVKNDKVRNDKVKNDKVKNTSNELNFKEKPKNFKEKCKTFKEKMKTSFKKELFSEEFSCVCCGEERMYNNHNYLCEKCFSKMTFIDTPCAKCGDQVGKFDYVCENCKDMERFFDKVACCVKYKGSAKTLVYKFKYFSQKYLLDCITNFMVETFNNAKFSKIDKVICVPLNKKRILERGYNQSDLLAREFCRKTNLKYCENFAIRIKDTPTQTHLNKEERAKNMKNAFFIPDNADLTSQNILIIDDVYTTGATINELSKVLKNKGAKRVYGLTFCHT